MSKLNVQDRLIDSIEKIGVVFRNRDFDVNNTLNELIHLFSSKLTSSYKTKYSSEDHSYISDLICFILLKCLDLPLSDKYLDFYEKEKKRIDEELSFVLEDDEIKYFVSSFHRLVSYSKRDEKKSDSDSYIVKYQCDDPLITPDSIRVLSKDIHTKFEKSKKIEKDKVVTEVLDSVIDKIDVSLPTLTYVFGILTSFFFLTGFVYNRFFLGHYGIYVQYFFSVGDYISTSLEMIYVTGILVIPILFGNISGFYFGFRIHVKRQVFELKDGGKPLSTPSSSLSYHLPFLILITLILIPTVYCFYLDLTNRYSLLSFLILIVFVYITGKLRFYKYFKNPIYIYLLILSLVTFSLTMYSLIMNQIDLINKTEVSELKKYKFTFEKDIHIDDSLWIPLSGNSEYFFFYDKEHKKSIVVPKSSIKYVETIK